MLRAKQIINKSAIALWVVALFVSVFCFQHLPLTNKFDFITSIGPLFAFTSLNIGLGLLILISSKKQDWNWHPKLINLLVLVFFLWTGLSFFQSEIQSFGFTEVYVLGNCTLIFFLSQHSKTQELIRKFLPLAITVLVIDHLIHGNIAFLTTDHSRFLGAFYNSEIKADAWPNAFASFALMVLPILFLTKIRKANTTATFKLIFASIFIAFFLLSFSRAAYLALLIQIGLTFILFRNEISKSFKKILSPRKRKYSLKKTWIPILMLSIITGIFFGMQQIRAQQLETTELTDRLQFNESEGGSSIIERFEFFQGSIALIKEEVFFGFGPGSFKYIYPQVQEGFLAISDHPHNILLKYGVERGLPAMLFFLGFLFFLFIRSDAHKKDSDTLNRLIWLGILGVMAHNMVDYNFNFISNSLILWIFFSALELKSHHQKKKGHAFIGVLILLIVLCTTNFKLYSDTKEFSTLKTAAIDQTLTNQAIEEFDPLIPRWSLFQLYDLLNDESDPKLELRTLLMEQELEINSSNIYAMERLINIKLSQNELESALNYALTHIQTNPKNTFLARMHALSIFKELGEIDAFHSLMDETETLIEEYKKLYGINLHYTQSSPEMGYIEVIEKL